MAKGRANSKKAAPKTVIAEPEPAPLFEIDTAGSSSVRHALLSNQSEASARLRKGQSFKKPLKSDQILAMRSGVPAVTSRLTTSTEKKRALVDRKTKERLKRIARKDGKGPGLWGIKDDKDEREEMVTEAVKRAGEYDPWSTTSKQPGEQDDGESVADPKVIQHHKPTLPKAPKTLHAHSLLDESTIPRAVPVPHAGTSYNPSFQDHQTLLAEAHGRYETLENREKKAEEIKQKMDELRKAGKAKETWELYEEEVGSGESDSDQDDKADEAPLPKKKKSSEPKRKTRQQRNRKLAAAEEAKLLAERRHRKKIAASIAKLADIQDQIDAGENLSLEVRAAALKLKKAKLASKGLTRLRSGPSKVPDAKVDFQLGEELSENLRTLKPEGNLWKDWLSSEMRRGKVPVERANAGRKGGQHGGSGRRKGSGTKVVERYASKNWQG